MNNIERQKTWIDIFEDPNISEREKYKYYTQNDEYVLKLKEKVRQTINQKGLVSIMNDTKWLKLQHGVQSLPFPPPYIEKLVLEEKSFEEVQISDKPRWFGDWSPFYQEGMFLFFAIEYIKVRPCYAEHNGRLVAPTIIDETAAFEQLLQELHIPYEEDKGVFIIYGYK
ncbi:hypothetical protein SAMN05421780_105224 [Flexibacter flexilis DSM 6793]|uniref:Uncharacterized protein n=1 Tax=Flexibacter flexilis DSM 6793 TaxID=927664 RepID=A0A1I1J7P9_9BACT|nr:DUF6678 family protein [Flexibacter flexilis]SFC44131.1 hypothetical protein SAMN05421780_105224 [Flexibacter flexilis DSM 6793]